MTSTIILPDMSIFSIGIDLLIPSEHQQYLTPSFLVDNKHTIVSSLNGTVI